MSAAGQRKVLGQARLGLRMLPATGGLRDFLGQVAEQLTGRNRARSTARLPAESFQQIIGEDAMTAAPLRAFLRKLTHIAGRNDGAVGGRAESLQVLIH